MAGAVHSYTKGGTLGSNNLTVTCPTNAPVGSVLALCIAVHGRNDMTTQHAYSTTQTGWTHRQTVDNYEYGGAGNPDNDYWQLWLFTRTKAAGDTSWTFPSKVQSYPCRTYVMVALTGVAEAPGSTASSQAITNETSHTFTGLTMNTAGDVFLGFTTTLSSEMSAAPSLTYIAGNTKAGDSPKVYPSKISAWHKVVGASGATGAFGYTSASGRDYASLSVEFNSVTGSQTADSPSMGELTVPAYAGTPKLAAENATARTTFDAAMTSERNVPILLATLSPLENDAPSAATVTERFASGWYNRTYQPAIQKWPEITRSLYGGSVVGGRVGHTIGELSLLNDRESVLGDRYGQGVVMGATLLATATGYSLVVQEQVHQISGTAASQLDAVSTSLVCGPSARGRLDSTATGSVIDGEGTVLTKKFYLASAYSDGQPDFYQEDVFYGSWYETYTFTETILMTHSAPQAYGASDYQYPIPPNSHNKAFLVAVSRRLAAQTISGTVKMSLQCFEVDAGSNINEAWVAIHVVSEDGLTLRATLLSVGQYDGGDSEFTVGDFGSPGGGLDGRTWIVAGTSLSSYTCAENDRLYVEFGVGKSGTGNGNGAWVSFGSNEPCAGELPFGYYDYTGHPGDGTDLVPYIEFSNLIEVKVG